MNQSGIRLVISVPTFTLDIVKCGYKLLIYATLQTSVSEQCIGIIYTYI